MFQLARIVLWTVAAVVALVYGYTGILTYHFDEQNLCIQSDGWLGRSVSRQVIPVASISSVELDMRAGRHAKHSVKIVGKDGGILRRDFLGLQDSNNLAEGLRCALRNHPVGTYEFSCGHTKYKGGGTLRLDLFSSHSAKGMIVVRNVSCDALSASRKVARDASYKEVNQ